MSKKIKILTLTVCVILSSFYVFFNIKLKSQNIKIDNHIKKDENTGKNNILDFTLKEDFLIVDLQNMKVDIVKEGQVTKTFNILSKGRPGSYYETPAGDYKIKGKYGNKFSNLGQVYMPYAMQFYGNFFIHGVPYHPNGTKVSSSYSGGCVRMDDVDAKEIYEFAKVNTRVLILTNAAPLENNDFDKGIITSDNMLTVLTSLEILNQEKYVTFKKQKVQIKNLNKHILQDDVEAKNIILNQIGKNNFLDSKIEKAIAIGLNDDTFESVNDRVKLFNYISANKSYILTLLN